MPVLQRPEPTPALKGCTPLRPDYASDLRDEALQAHNATGLLVNQNVSFILSQVLKRVSPECHPINCRWCEPLL